MRFTRCPECRTTFRITNEALEKAEGRVRCGRCSNIFNALEELCVEPHTESKSAARDEPPRRERSSEGTNWDFAAEDVSEHVVLETARSPADRAGASTVAPGSSPGAETVPVWTLESVESVDDPGGERRSGLWLAAASLAALALLVQAVNHFRAELADAPILGPSLAAAYALAGIELQPRWDAGLYEILDSGAVTEPGAGAQSHLIIRSMIRNRAARPQPYPLVHLKLLDRWQKPVGARIFRPSEYLETAETRLMAAGDTTEAQLVVVDPGPDAYGFELDVCVETEQRVECANDRVFR